MFEDAIQVYIEQGIVTRKEILIMDSRSQATEIFNTINKYGYGNPIRTEINRDNYHDYSSAIYDSDRYSHQEVEKYMLKYVLV
jgi:hypothetical protein